MQHLPQKAVWVTTIRRGFRSLIIKTSLLQQPATAHSHAAGRRYPVQNQLPDQSEEQATAALVSTVLT